MSNNNPGNNKENQSVVLNDNNNNNSNNNNNVSLHTHLHIPDVLLLTCLGWNLKQFVSNLNNDDSSNNDSNDNPTVLIEHYMECRYCNKSLRLENFQNARLDSLVSQNLDNLFQVFIC